MSVKEKMYSELINHLPCGYARHQVVKNSKGQPIDYIFLEVNSAFEQMTGFVQAQIIGKKVTEVVKGIEKESFDWIRRYGQVASTGKSDQFEQYSETLKKWYMITVFSPEKDIFIVLTNETTGNKETEHQLRALMCSQDDIILEFNKQCEYVNAWTKDEKNLFVPKEQFLGKKIGDVVPGELSRTFEEALALVFSKGESITVEYASPIPGKESYWSAKLSPVLEQGKLTDRAVCVTRDITAKKKIEKELKQKYALLESLIANMPFEFWVADECGYVFIQNKVHELNWGHLCGKPHPDLIAENRVLQNKLLGGESVSDELVHIRGDTKIVYHRIIVPIRIDGKVSQILGVNIDMSEQQKAEADKQKIHAQLLHSSKLASIGTLAAGVAHEINNPLAIIKGHVAVLRHQQLGEEVLRILTQQDKAVDRIANIVNNLRTFARTDVDVGESIDIHSAIKSSISLIDYIFQKEQIEIELDFNCGQSIVQINLGKFQQVMVNMLTNARDAFSMKKPGNKIIIRTENDLENIKVLVIDNGRGILPEHLSQIFDPFFTTKPVGVGTGLGLSISQNIISSYKGNIEIQSEVGKGSTFTIILPLNNPK